MNRRKNLPSLGPHGPEDGQILPLVVRPPTSEDDPSSSDIQKGGYANKHEANLAEGSQLKHQWKLQPLAGYGISKACPTSPILPKRSIEEGRGKQPAPGRVLLAELLCWASSGGGGQRPANHLKGFQQISISFLFFPHKGV